MQSYLIINVYKDGVLIIIEGCIIHSILYLHVFMPMNGISFNEDGYIIHI